MRHLIHDRDTKFGKASRKALKIRRIAPIRIPYRAPQMNAFVERFIRAVRQECLHQFVVLGQRHLDHRMGEFGSCYLRERPHQGRQNLPLDWTPLARRRWRARDGDPNLTLGEIRCQKRMGGLIKHFYRDAA